MKYGNLYSPQDYTMWRKEVEDYLCQRELDAAIKPGEQNVSESMDAEVRSILLELIGYFGEEVLEEVGPCKTAREIWVKLEWMRKTPYELYEKRKRLYNYKIDTLEEVPEMIVEFQDLVLLLDNIGKPIPPVSDLVHIIANSMPRDYKNYLVGCKKKFIQKGSWRSLCTRILMKADELLTERRLQDNQRFKRRKIC